MFLLDTNVLSDSTKAVPNPAVTEWLETRPISMLFVSVVSLAEANYGIERLQPGRKADGLRQWLGSVITDFGDRLLPVDAEVAMAQARIRRAAENAEIHGLTLVTRNVRDFEGWDGPVLNPWSV